MSRIIGWLWFAAAGVCAQDLSLAIDAAIERGALHLASHQAATGQFHPRGNDTELLRTYPDGLTGLAVYALMNAGMDRDDPVIVSAVACLEAQKFDTNYEVATMIMALHATRDPRHDQRIREGADWLVAQDRPTGLWAYPKGQPDLSNSQFAVLALRMAEQHGHATPAVLWTKLVETVLGLQREDGGFGYRPTHWRESSGAMTAAALAILHLAKARLAAEQTGPDPRTLSAAIGKAWRYLDRFHSDAGNPRGDLGVPWDRHPGGGREVYFHYYYLFALERATALSGRSLVGWQDWYRSCAVHMLRNERAGDFGGFLNTAFALLVLRRATARSLQSLDGPVTVERSVWKYTTEAPTETWTSPTYDDSQWSIGEAGFGEARVPGVPLRTRLAPPDVWMRRYIPLGPETRREATLRIVHLGDLEVFADGTSVYRKQRTSNGPAEIALPESVRGAGTGGLWIAARATRWRNDLVIDIKVPPSDRSPFRADARGTFWREAPSGLHGMIRSWLVSNPSPDHDFRGFLDIDVLRDFVSIPKAGSSEEGGAWMAQAAAVDGGVVFSTESGGTDLTLAFTWITVERPTDVVFWVGGGPGLRVILDANVLGAVNELKPIATDHLRIPVSLTAGRHRFLVKVRHGRADGRLIVRVTDPSGNAIEGLRVNDWSK